MTDEEADRLAWETKLYGEIDRLKRENKRLRTYALKAFTVVEFCCGEGFLLEPPFYDCDDLLLEGCILFDIEDSQDARNRLAGQQ